MIDIEKAREILRDIDKKMSFTDEELECLVEYFEKLIPLLSALPREYRLMVGDLNRKFGEYNGYLNSRKKRSEY